MMNNIIIRLTIRVSSGEVAAKKNSQIIYYNSCFTIYSNLFICARYGYGYYTGFTLNEKIHV